MSSPQIPTPAPASPYPAAPPRRGFGPAVGIIGLVTLVVALVPLGFAIFYLIDTATYDGDEEFAALGYVVAVVLGAPALAAATLAGAAVALRRTIAGVVLVSIAVVLGFASLMLMWPWVPIL